MIRFFLRRLAASLVSLFLVVTIVFLLINAVGDPARANLGARASAEMLARYREAHGLNRPLRVRYAEYLGGLVRGDFGRSYRTEEPVSEILARSVPRTMLIGSMALLFEITIGLAVGILAASRRNSAVDTLSMSLAILGVSAPTFVTGLLFTEVVAFRWGWFPVGGYGVGAWGHLQHAILPAITLALVGAATYARVMRGEMAESLRADFVRTARAKGAGPMRVLLRHGARNALLPIVTLAGLSLPLLVSGAVVTESVYGWPGMGFLMVRAIDNLDVPMVMGGVLVASFAVQIGNLLADLGLAALDPRVRFSAGS